MQRAETGPYSHSYSRSSSSQTIVGRLAGPVGSAAQRWLLPELGWPAPSPQTNQLEVFLRWTGRSAVRTSRGSSIRHLARTGSFLAVEGGQWQGPARISDAGLAPPGASLAHRLCAGGERLDRDNDQEASCRPAAALDRRQHAGVFLSRQVATRLGERVNCLQSACCGRCRPCPAGQPLSA
jgi:hypothetical protein